jgi:protein-disulfide isomerase
MATLRAPVTPRDHLWGSDDALVVMVEYGDYQCPYCRLAQPVVWQLLEQAGRDLALVFRHFPLSEAHPMADVAAQAAEFAGAYGLFWPMHEALYENQAQLGPSTIFAIAGALGLSQTGLQRALEKGTYAPKVREDFMGGVRSGVNATPCFFINGVRHDGAYTFGALAAAIGAARRDAMAPASAPGTSPGQSAQP